jgi:UDP-2-acetamido-3-amino-2,3-dideoxy-glucuronate N-acetyltransferase
MKKTSYIRKRSSSSAQVCVAGCGHWGKNLIRNFHALGHLRAICDANPVSVSKFAKEYPDAKAYLDFSEVLADPEIDAVVLATPAEMHHRMAMEALAAGKDVFVEKPLALDIEEGQEVLDTARDMGAVLMVGHLLRYHPAILKIQELITSGVLGRVEYIYSNRLSMGKIRHEENALWSFAPHDISVILALVGHMPVQVTATGGAYLQPNIADVTVSNLLFDNGARSHIFVSWLHPYKEQRLVVVGSRQMVVFEDTKPTEKLVLFDKRIEWKNGSMEAAKPTGTPIPFDPDEPLRQECAHFIDCILNRRDPVTTGEEGLRVLQVLQACQRSLQMNGEPVQVAARGLRKIMAI